MIRFLLRNGTRATDALAILGRVCEASGYKFWPDSLPYGRADLRAVIGHRQVTDAYLVTLARSRRCRLATFDRGLVAVYPEVVVLIGS